MKVRYYIIDATGYLVIQISKCILIINHDNKYYMKGEIKNNEVLKYNYKTLIT